MTTRSPSAICRRRFLTMNSEFPEYACPYSRKLAARSPRYALQVSAAGEAPARAEDFAQGDPFGELAEAGRIKGLKQRFPDRVLLMTTDHCFVNCRHCTRRWLLGRSETVATAEDLARCVEYVKARPNVRDVLLSGGDFLTLSDERVKTFVNAFAELPQIEIIRVCSRALCANPARITPDLVKILAQSKKVWVNTQFNCADEVTAEARAAAALLVDAGIPVSCQTVLLKGVNDEPEQMLQLLRALSAARIRPYYVFMCDPIPGIDRFRVDLERAREIENYCAERIGGLALPRFVADLPHARRKMPISFQRDHKW